MVALLASDDLAGAAVGFGRANRRCWVAIVGDCTLIGRAKNRGGGEGDTFSMGRGVKLNTVCYDGH